MSVRRRLAACVVAAALCTGAAARAETSPHNPHPLVTDPAGDGSNFVGTEASPPRTDVVAVDIHDSPTAVTFSMSVVDLEGDAPSLQDAVNRPNRDDYLIHTYVGSTRLTVEADHDLETGVSSFWFYTFDTTDGYSGAYAVPGDLDTATDTVHIVVPTSVIESLLPGFGRGTVLSGIESFARSYRFTFSSSVTSPVDEANDPDVRYVVGR